MLLAITNLSFAITSENNLQKKYLFDFKTNNKWHLPTIY